MFEISIKDIKNVCGKSKKIAVCIENEQFFDAYRLHSPMLFDGVVSNKTDYFEVIGELQIFLNLMCDRCGQGFVKKLALPFKESYAFKKACMDSVDEEDVYGFTGDTINIRPQVEANLFVELPFKILCTDDCRGLCSGCGVNLNFEVCRCGVLPIKQ